jgi:3-deoxy-D-manno-octulosonic-acid transferase
MLKYFLYPLIPAAVLTFSGCACVPGGIADSNTPLHAKAYTVIGQTSANDSRYAILGIIPITGGNTLKEAIETAKSKVSADALIDITVDSYAQFWILFSRTVTRVDAKGIRFQNEQETEKRIVR